MKNFIFKSPETYQKLFQLIETTQKNVLYLTYRIDDMYKILKRLDADKGLQKQVDDYFQSDYEKECTEGQDPELKKDLD